MSSPKKQRGLKKQICAIEQMEKSSVAGGSVSKSSLSGHINLIAVEMDRQNDSLTIKEILYCNLFLVKKKNLR